MRLIDADELTKILMEEIPLAENVHIFKDMIENQKTAYCVDKVVKRLEELQQLDACEFDACPFADIDCWDCAQRRMVERAIEIVKAGGVNVN